MLPPINSYPSSVFFVGILSTSLNFWFEESYETLSAIAGSACHFGPSGLWRLRSRTEHRWCVRLLGIRRAEQVTSVNQLNDVDPTDLAYQALVKLVKTYGYVAGYLNGSFLGYILITRY